MRSFEKLVGELQQITPFRIRYKDESIEMHLLNLLVAFFCPNFLTKYTTVIGSTIYFPSKYYIEQHPEVSMRILAHEAVHLLDMDKWSRPLFMFGYLFPQILVLGVFLFPWIGLWALGFLIFALPIPSPFRYYFEARGYAIDVLTAHPTNKIHALEHAVKHFSDWNYYKMYPFEDEVRQGIMHWVRKTEAGEDKDILKILLVYELVAES